MTVPDQNWGKRRAPESISPAPRRLRFGLVRKGGEIVRFIVGGIGRDPVTGKAQDGHPYPDSSPAIEKTNKAY